MVNLALSIVTVLSLSRWVCRRAGLARTCTPRFARSCLSAVGLSPCGLGPHVHAPVGALLGRGARRASLSTGKDRAEWDKRQEAHQAEAGKYCARQLIKQYLRSVAAPAVRPETFSKRWGDVPEDIREALKQGGFDDPSTLAHAAE